MKFSAFSVLSGAFALATISLTGCKKDDEPVASSATEFTLHMDNGVTMPVAGSTTPKFTSLVLGSGTYKNANGDDFTVSTLKYYISNVKLNKADGSSYAVPNTYFLVDHSKPDTQDLTMTDVPEGEYSSVTFVVGVDSMRTKAGGFGGGVLNASNGMLWDMNGAPEFINFKLEGNSPQAKSATNASGGIVFHVAGYLHSTTNTIRTVTVPFNTSKLIIARDHKPEVHMQVEVANMFGKPLNPPTNTVAPINFATTYTIMSGIPAARLADNIQTSVFSVGHIHAN